ncbi:hypothetical protein E8E14_006783 [Neopestalotiopsis sp. 37M]|nr:hypothetical protein E8E14_006783 [Neopestalotiopsis sp. 37M]
MDLNSCVAAVAFGVGSQLCSTTKTFAQTEYRWIFWLSLAAAGAFSAVSCLRSLHLLFRRSSIIHAPVYVFALKLIFCAAFAGLRLALLVEGLHSANNQSGSFKAARALDFTASCLLLILSQLEHFRSPRPSILGCGFLLLTFIYDVSRCPLLWETGAWPNEDQPSSQFAQLFTACIPVQFALLILESVQRRRWIIWSADDHSPEETSSIISLGLYAWLNPLLWTGYRKSLEMEDLYPLDLELCPRVASGDGKLQTGGGSSGFFNWELAMWLAESLGWQFLLAVFPRLCLIGFNLCQPFFLQYLLDYLANDTGSDSLTSSGLVVTALFIYLGIAISTALYWYSQERFQSQLRAFLIAAIYQKTNRIVHKSDGDLAAVTLMGADVERIYTGIRSIHEVWANAIQIPIALWLLYRQVGNAFIAPLIIVIIGFGLSYMISQRAISYQTTWMSSVQKRTGVTSEALSQVKDLRVTGMAVPAGNLVKEERENEIHVGQRARTLIATSASLSQLPQAISPALTFAFVSHVLDQTRAYTALLLLSLLTAPLQQFLQIIPIIAASVASLNRIWHYLTQDDWADYREFRIDGPPNIESEKGSDPVVGLSHASFGWSAGKTAIQDVSLEISRASITFVTGPIGSGKSTLCKALLGEVPSMQGTVWLRSKSVAYCDQKAVIFNASIRANIIAHSSFAAERYDEVIWATMLREDLEQMPGGDRTVVGSKGVSLSGGQRQRISLARALYAEADILILDDVFSALDGSTQTQVGLNLFGKHGVLRKRQATTIASTHAVSLLALADRVITISGDGLLTDQHVDNHSPQWLQNSHEVENSRIMNDTPQGSEDIGAVGTIIKGPTVKTKQEPLIHRPDGPEGKESHRSPSLPIADSHIYRQWLQTVGLAPLVIFVVLVIGSGFFPNFQTVWLKFISSDSTQANPQHSWAYWIGLYAFFGAATVLCIFPAGLVMLRTGVRNTGTDFHHKVVDAVMNSSLRFLGTTDVGKILNLFTQDMTILDTMLPRMVNNLSFTLSSAIGQAVVIAISSGWLALSYPIFIALIWAVQHVYLPTSKRLRILDLEAKTPLYVGAGLVTLTTLASTLSTIVVAYTGLETSLGAISRLTTFIDQTEQEVRTDKSNAPDKSWPDRGCVEFHNVNAGYTHGSFVLRDFNLQISANEKIAICGRTGSGKSSVLALLLRLFEPNIGDSSPTGTEKLTSAIIMDGVPLNQVDQSILRERIIAESQDATFLPSGTSFRDNLDPWKAASDEECTAALADLGLLNLVSAKGGLTGAFVPGELSSGQKQLLSFARAVLRRRVKLRTTTDHVDGGLLLLDEVTSSTDSETERIVLRFLMEEFSKYTAVLSLSANTDNTTSLSSETKVGWYSGPTERGTLSLVWSCVATIIACTWTILHLNVPEQGETAKTKVLRKAKWMAITILFPEFIFSKAVCELRLALKTLREAREAILQYQDDTKKITSEQDSTTPQLDLVTQKEDATLRFLYRLMGLCVLKLDHEGSSEVGRKQDVEPGSRRRGSPGSVVNSTDIAHSGQMQIWTLMHSYLANMGGIVYSEKGPRSATYVLTGYHLGRQYEWLKSFPLEGLDHQWRRSHPLEGLVLSTNEIKDKSKADWLLKSLSVLQISSLVLTVAVRGAMSLPLTQLEIATVAFSVLAIITYAANWWKPKDISEPIVVPHRVAGFHSTGSETCYDYTESFMAVLRDPADAKRLEGHTIERRRVSNDVIDMDGDIPLVLILMAVSSVLFGGLHCLAWNFDFPSDVELQLWRVASITSALLPISSLGLSILLNHIGVTYIHKKMSIWIIHRTKDHMMCSEIYRELLRNASRSWSDFLATKKQASSISAPSQSADELDSGQQQATQGDWIQGQHGIRFLESYSQRRLREYTMDEIHTQLFLSNQDRLDSMTDSCLKSIESTLPPHVTVYGFTCPEPGPSAVEGKVDAVISAADSFRALHPLLQADPKRFDGLLVACFSAHPLIAMLREEYEQPVMGIMEAALYASRMCGERVGIVTTSERSAVMHARSTVEYGFGNYSVGCETGHVSVLELESLPRDVVYAGLSAAAQRLVEKGADCICLGCAGMTGMREAVSGAVGMDERKAMVVDGVAIGVHFLTALAQESLGTPKSGVYRSSAAGRARRGQQWL